MFSKKDLNNGNVVEIRNGQKFLYHNIDRSKILDIRGYNYLELNSYDENFNRKAGHSEIFDIIKVYQDYTCKEVLWERKEKPQLTGAEKEILRNLPKEYKWIARDSVGSIYVYIDKPNKIGFVWAGFGNTKFPFNHLFQFVQWNDEEPYSIEELLEE